MKHSTSFMVQLCCTCLLLIALVSFSACKKWTRVDLPIDKVTAATVFSNDETAKAAVLGIYSELMPTLPFFSCGGTTIYAGLAADELFLSNSPLPEEQEFAQNSLSPANSTAGQYFWLRPYRHIYHANAVIEGLSAPNGVSPSLKNNLLGEAKFIRAFCYFYLINLFGDVPLITETGYKQNAQAPRAPTSIIYKQILEDLQEAKNNLPVSYPAEQKLRPTRWAAAALLARVYLYQKEWALAEAEATGVMTSGSCSLEPDAAKVFLSGSTEAIWQLAPVEAGFNTTEGLYLAAIFGQPDYALTESLLGAFEPADKRKEAWMAVDFTTGVPLFYPFKYKQKYDFGTGITERYMMLRLAEQVLIRAEARAEQNKLAEAREDLNTLRSRAGLPDITTADKATLLAAIEAERRIELFAEWGHRWFDLKRTGRINTVLGSLKSTWKPAAALFPVPQSELLRNPALTQNPGY